MTTHDQEKLTDSYDESQTADAEMPPVSEHTEPAASADPSTASAEPSLPSSAPEDPSAGGSATNGAAAVPAEEVSAEHLSTERESSPEELLFAGDELADMRTRWAAVQAGFVDDPKECVHKADGLVSDLVEQLTSGFADARSRLEEQWARGEEASTEDLRVALMHYREFFERLLAV
jgi:hypothetical protein